MTDEERIHSSTGSAGVGPTEDVPADTERAPNTLLNVFIGGIAGVVLSFIPFSTVLGTRIDPVDRETGLTRTGIIST